MKNINKRKLAQLSVRGLGPFAFIYVFFVILTGSFILALPLAFGVTTILTLATSPSLTPIGPSEEQLALQEKALEAQDRRLDTRIEILENHTSLHDQFLELEAEEERVEKATNKVMDKINNLFSSNKKRKKYK